MAPAPADSPALVFRSLSASFAPGAGEVCFRAHVAPPVGSPQVALDLFADPGAAICRGPGPLTAIIVGFGNTGPTLDDMLATTLLRLHLRGEAPPPGLEAFARFAARLRKGFRGASREIRLDRSLDGLYLETCRVWDADRPPAEPEAKQRAFLASWAAIERAILAEARAGADPATWTFAADDFPEQVRRLDEDALLYGLDKDKGERFWVTLPGRAERVAGLLLRTPRSSLFKHWAREDPESGSAEGYGFLAVRHVAGNWVFTTAPAWKASLLFLAERLQHEEDAAEEGSSGRPDNPWFCGARFDHTLVAAPHGGSALSEEHVLRTMRDALRAEPRHSLQSSYVTDQLLAQWPLPAFAHPKLLGAGGQEAPVFRAEREGRLYALKIFGLEGPGNWQRNQRELRTVVGLERETRGDPAARFLALPSEVLRVGFCRGRELAVLVAPYFGRGNLWNWRERKGRTIALPALLRVVETAGRGLALLHRRGLVHFDIKPQNILVSDTEEAALTDFGCAMRAGSNTSFRDPLFAPPCGETSRKADVVSFAYVLTWLIARRRDFCLAGHSSVRTTVLDQARREAAVEGVGDDWYDTVTELLLEATQADPRARPEIDELLERLGAIPPGS